MDIPSARGVESGAAAVVAVVIIVVTAVVVARSTFAHPGTEGTPGHVERTSDP